ncbi:unnamed protein product [Phaedon cochleariae]|uniref:Protein MMS22-like n=1 Tax=Phaedon cochleariae TaxID=80249 RepID=A0A9P0DBZ2_PHACE|nr:unnamed protein product [Phaedon cochleariae]
MSNYLLICEKNCENEVFNNLQTVFIPKCKELEDANPKIFIGEHFYNKNIIIEEIDILMRLVQSEWCIMQNIALYDDIVPYEEIVYSREFINKSFMAIKDCIQLCTHQPQKERYMNDTLKKINSFSNLVVPLDQISEEFVLKVSALKENDTKNPVYQYLHTFLELQYYLFTLQYLCKASAAEMEKAVEKILTSLIVLSKKHYQRQVSQIQKNVGCSCMKDFLLVIQLLLQKTVDDDFTFWRVFNRVLEDEVPLFSLWLLRHVAELQMVNSNFQIEGNTCEHIRPNYELLLNKLKPFLHSADSDMTLKLLEIIEPLLCNIWLKNAKIEVYQTIWDYFSKRLNVSKKNYSSHSALELNEAIENILWSWTKCNEDFEKFVGMMICHLKEYPAHWGKMKGRIYSQLGPNKLKELGETGIVHVMLLFIALGTINYEELLKKIVSFFESLPTEKKNTKLVWNIYTAFMFLQVRQGHDLEKTAPLLLKLIQEASMDHKDFHLIKEFVTNFENILNFSDKMQLHQWIFLDSWLSNYLPSCYYADMNSTLDVLSTTLEKVENADSWSYWMDPFKDHVLPILKQTSSCYNAPAIIGKLAGKLYLIIAQSSTDIFQFFTGENISPKISSQFLTVVLDNYPSQFILTAQQEALVVQSWVKICLLTSGPCGDLTKNIIKLDIFPQMLKSHIETSPDPIHALIEYLGSDIKHHQHSPSINKLCELSFGHLDKWLTQYLQRPENETAVLRIYTCVYLAFSHCGPLLYHRSRNSCPLTKLIQCMLLSMEFLTRKTVPHEFVLNAVKKTWHYFYEALVKMRTDSDMFLERTLKDMITKYMLYFSTGDSPIIKSLENEAVAPVVLEKICSSYFKHPFKEEEANTLKIMKILGDVIRSTTSIPLLKLIVNKTVYGLFEVVIFHSQRNAAISLIKIITSSPLYPQIKGEFSSVMLAVTEKHNNMAFNTVNYFQLMIVLAKFVPNDVKDLLGNVKQQVINVERLRGVGFDKNLRLQYEKLEDAVKSIQ